MTTDPRRTVFEIALYRVNDGEVFARHQHELHDIVCRFSGYVRATALRSHDQPDVFADVVEWSSIDAATAAATEIADSEVMSWFGTQCAEVLFFGHLEQNPFVTSSEASPVEGSPAPDVATA